MKNIYLFFLFFFINLNKFILIKKYLPILSINSSRIRPQLHFRQYLPGHLKAIKYYSIYPFS
jgi:hypothetical protein